MSFTVGKVRIRSTVPDSKPRIRSTGVVRYSRKEREERDFYVPKPKVSIPKPEIIRAPNLSRTELAYALPGGLAKLAFPNWFYGAHLKVLEDIMLKIVGGEPQFILASAPPRHGKTRFISEICPAFFLGHKPDDRVMLITYQQDFSRARGRIARRIFRKYAGEVFGLKVSEESASAESWDIEDHEGGMESIGAQGAIMGKGAKLLIIDDPIKGFEQASNPVLLEKLWIWLLTDVFSRLEPGASVIIICTRWAINDPIGMILQKIAEFKAMQDSGEVEVDPDEFAFGEFKYINFPAIAVEGDYLGRQPGEALWPKRFDKKALKRRKSMSDDWWWEAMYQGNPRPMKGSIIDLDWFRTRWGSIEEVKRSSFDRVVLSVDTASKENEISDYTALGVWGIKGELYYLVDLLHEKMEYPKLKTTVEEFINLWHPEDTLIEDKGSGITLLQDMRGSPNTTLFPVQPGQEGKVIRLQTETPVIRAGRIVLPKEASWLEGYLGEAAQFPKGRKDQMDMTSQFLKHVRMQSSGIQMWSS